MTFFRIAVIALLITLSGGIHAADGPGDVDKLRGEVGRLTSANAELTRKVAELTRAKADCQHVLQQMQRANTDD